MKDGTRIGNYTLVRKIGSGGMSNVYLAKDRAGNEVVVKQLRSEFSENDEFVKRFRQAASIMRQLNHPHIACALDYVEQDGYCLLIEEYLPGGSLEDRLHKGQRIPEKQALSWCRDVLLGVDTANVRGIIHRDLKPGNLMFSESGAIKVTDFGIAKAFGGPHLTRTRAEMGTPAYMSPEQIRRPDDVYHLTDVYSMGVVLYELLTEKLPFDKESDFDTKQAVIKEPPPPLRSFNPDISDALEDIVLKAMQKDPAQRFGGCAEFAEEVERYLKGGRIRLGATGWVKKLAFVGALLLVASIAILWALRPVPGPTNLALGGTANQSSELQSPRPGPARLAIDGNVDGNFFHGSVTHTDDQPYAWWEVDLGRPATITKIVLFNRTDCCQDRLSNFQVSVRNGIRDVYTKDFEGPIKQKEEFDLPRKTRGQIVRIEIMKKAPDGTQILSLAEVQVMGVRD